MTKDKQNSNWELAGAITTLLLALVSINAIWGLTSSDDTAISGWLRGIAPLPYWSASGFACAALYIGVGLWSKHSTRVGVGLMIFTYLLGSTASRFAYHQIQPPGGVPFDAQLDIFPALWERSFLLWPAIPMIVIYWIFFKNEFPQSSSWGQWRQTDSQDTSDRKKGDWRKYLLYYILLLVLPLGLMMQTGVGFGPIRNANVLIFIGPLAALALFNGFSEELIFRGLFQPAFVKRFGPSIGITLQGIFFGVHHWGASPDLIAGLPTAIATCALGILWGRSVLATGGMGWAIVTHALVDLAFFAAYFVDPD